ncbi:uncharacterized protein LOC133188467 [Saccostrea echinata]|uniref:uncharacterized protein LOC133188467 n=1 Tax=Saccostrea echinata TaxID=191078 RepID=UPI002A8327A3|nr:uncharacterized protein LOC133188467 [Saccostrea echinata]
MTMERQIAILMVFNLIQNTAGFLPTKCTADRDVITCFNQTYITPKSFPPSMVELRLAHSTITNIQGGFLHTLTRVAPGLKTIIINSSAIKYMHACSFSTVSNLSQILVQDSSVKEIVQNAFSDLKSIQKIEFINVRIEEISKLAFHGVQGIGLFKMDNLTVQNMSYASFAELEDVNVLQLTNSYIQLTESQPIVNHKSVSSLVITGNTFKSTLCGFNILQPGLVFTNNNLTCNTEMAANLSSIRNNRCLWNVKDVCPELKDTSIVKHSYDCRAITLDEGIQPVSQNEILDIEDSEGPRSCGLSSLCTLNISSLLIMYSVLISFLA